MILLYVLIDTWVLTHVSIKRDSQNPFSRFRIVKIQHCMPILIALFTLLNRQVGQNYEEIYFKIILVEIYNVLCNQSLYILIYLIMIVYLLDSLINSLLYLFLIPHIDNAWQSLASEGFN